MAADSSTHLDLAKEALNNLPDSADRDTILAAVHRHLTIDRDVRSAQMVVDARAAQSASHSQSWWSEWMGCLLPVLLIPALFLAMPLLFSLGERIVSRPTRTTATGIIDHIEFVDGSTDESLVGRKCRVTADHVLVDKSADEMLVIPSEAFRTLQLKDKSE